MSCPPHRWQLLAQTPCSAGVCMDCGDQKEFVPEWWEDKETDRNRWRKRNNGTAASALLQRREGR